MELAEKNHSLYKELLKIPLNGKLSAHFKRLQIYKDTNYTFLRTLIIIKSRSMVRTN